MPELLSESSGNRKRLPNLVIAEVAHSTSRQGNEPHGVGLGMVRDLGLNARHSLRMLQERAAPGRSRSLVRMEVSFRSKSFRNRIFALSN
jgi:hypothetical protein